MPQPSSSADSDSSRNERLEQILADYLHAREAGEQVDPQLIIAAHPDLADDLRSFFQNHAAVNQLAAPLREVLAPADTPTIDQASASDPAGIGTKLKYFGDYELLDEIARGGMGVVFKAKQLSLKRIVAVKMILAGQLASEAAMQRFRSEAEAAAQLDHPNIVPIFEIGEHAQQHYFSMAYIEGQSLADIVRQQTLPADRAARYVRTIALAIHYAHGQGVLHRDLKPSNVLIDAFDQPRVTDFGLAKSMKSEAGMTATGDVLGTPSYMPPEQAAGKTEEIGPASDVYSLGAMLYELVTGRPPFRAATPLDTVMQVMVAEPAPPRVLNPAISKDLETIILKCLRKEPRARYASANALADDLLALLEGRPIQARRPGIVEKAARWLKRQKRSAVIAAVASGAAVVLTVALVAAWQQYQYEQLGFVMLKTSGPPLKAEILNEYNELVVPSFTVPTEQPVEVLKGSYWLRLSAPNQLSETFQIQVEPGHRQQATVQLTPRLFKVNEEALPPGPPLFDLGPEEREVNEGDGEQFLIDPSVAAALKPDPDSPAGKFAALLPKLGFRPVAQPRWVQLAAPSVILLRREKDRSLMMLAVEVASAKIVWQQPLQAYWPKQVYYYSSNTGYEHDPTWPLVEDLNGDGTLEIIVPELSPIQHEATLGLAVHDVKTGKRKWGRAIHPYRHDNFGFATIIRFNFDGEDVQSLPPALRFITGPDINGDGSKEIFVTSLQMRAEHSKARMTVLLASALSGVDGKTIWQWHSPGEDTSAGTVNQPRWWRTGSDGFPELLVPYASSPAYTQLNTTYVLSARNGQLRHILPNVNQPLIADMNGDQTPDLFDPSPARFRNPPPVGRWPIEVLSGNPQQAWQRLGFLEPVADLNGDGTLDLRVRTGTSDTGSMYWAHGVVSGRSGELLWRLPSSLNPARPEDLRQLDLDFDADGTPDLAFFERTGTSHWFAAISGKTGHLLWKQELTVPREAGYTTGFEQMEAHDVTGDGRPELICSYVWHHTPPGGNLRYRHWLTAYDATTGKSLWQVPLCEETSSQASKQSENRRIESSDVDGDGRRDLVLWSNGFRTSHTYDEVQPPNALIALRGTDGKTLWQWDLPEHSLLPTEHQQGDNGPLPTPALADLNGDGVDDVVAMHHYYPPLPRVERPATDVGFFEVFALDGKNGKSLWTYRQTDGDRSSPGSHQPSPRIMRLNGGPHVVVRLPHNAAEGQGSWIRELLVLLNSQGKLVEPADLNDPAQQDKYQKLKPIWDYWICDLDGDGSDEAVTYDGTDLVAWQQGVTKELWRFVVTAPKLTDPAQAVSIVEPMGPTPPPRSFGFELKLLGVCESIQRETKQPLTLTISSNEGLFGLQGATGQPLWHASWIVEQTKSLQADSRAELPLILHQSSAQVASVQFAQAWPGNTLKSGSALATSEPTHSPRLPRCLPWAGEYLRWYSWVNGYFFFYGGAAELTAAGLACLTLAAWLGCLAWSKKSRRWAWTAVASAALGLLLGAIKFNPDAIVVTLKYGLLAVLPVLAFLIILATNLWQTHWRQVAIIVGSALAISLVVAFTWFAIDAPTLTFNERYVATQDWSIVLIGMHVVGAGLLLRLVVQQIRKTSCRRVTG